MGASLSTPNAEGTSTKNRASRMCGGGGGGCFWLHRMRSSSTSGDGRHGSSSAWFDALELVKMAFLLYPEEASQPIARVGLSSDALALRNDEKLFRQRRIQEMAKIALNKTELTSEFFSNIRELPAWVRQFLPDKDSVGAELRPKVAAVEDELNTVYDLVLDVVAAVSTGNVKLQTLGCAVEALKCRGEAQINRIRAGTHSWSNTALSKCIANVKIAHSDLETFVNGIVKQLLDRVSELDGAASIELIKDINGTGAAQVTADVVRRMKQKTDAIIASKSQFEKQRAETRMLDAEWKRYEHNLQRLSETVTYIEGIVEGLQKDLDEQDKCQMEDLRSQIAKQAQKREQLADHQRHQAVKESARMDEGMKTLRQHADAAYKDAIRVSEQTSLQTSQLAPEPQVHFLFLLDKSGSMQGTSWSDLCKAWRQLGESRQAMQPPVPDRTTVVMYDDEAYIQIYSKTWSDALNCTDKFHDKCSGRTNFQAAFTKAAEVMAEQPPHPRQKTVIVMVTDGVSQNPGVKAAEALQKACSARGPSSAFVILVGNDTEELAMLPIIKALNNKQVHFTDDRGGLQSYCSHVRFSEELSDKFALIARYTDLRLLQANFQTRVANEKMERAQEVLAKQANQLKLQEANMHNHFEEELKRLNERGVSDTDAIKERHAQIKESTVQLHASWRQRLALATAEFEEYAAGASTLEEALRQAELKEKELKQASDKMEEIQKDDSLLDEARQHIQRSRNKYWTISTAKLLKSLKVARDMMANSRVTLKELLEQFDSISKAAKLAICDFEDMDEDMNTPDARGGNLANQVVDTFVQQGAPGVTILGGMGLENYKRILAHCCPQSSPDERTDFAQMIGFKEIVHCCETPEVDKRGTVIAPKTTLKKMLKQRLREKLKEQEKSFRKLSSAASLRNNKVEKELKRVDSEVEKLELQIQKLDQQLDALDADQDSKREMLLQKQEKLEATLTNLLDKKQAIEDKFEDEQQDVESKIDDELFDKHVNLFNMIPFIADEISNALVQTQLALGCDAVVISLIKLHQLFEGDISGFFFDVQQVYSQYRKGGANLPKLQNGAAETPEEDVVKLDNLQEILDYFQPSPDECAPAPHIEDVSDPKFSTPGKTAKSVPDSTPDKTANSVPDFTPCVGTEKDSSFFTIPPVEKDVFVFADFAPVPPVAKEQPVYKNVSEKQSPPPPVAKDIDQSLPHVPDTLEPPAVHKDVQDTLQPPAVHKDVPDKLEPPAVHKDVPGRQSPPPPIVKGILDPPVAKDVSKDLGPLEPTPVPEGQKFTPAVRSGFWTKKGAVDFESKKLEKVDLPGGITLPAAFMLDDIPDHFRGSCGGDRDLTLAVMKGYAEEVQIEMKESVKVGAKAGMVPPELTPKQIQESIDTGRLQGKYHPWMNPKTQQVVSTLSAVLIGATAGLPEKVPDHLRPHLTKDRDIDMLTWKVCYLQLPDHVRKALTSMQSVSNDVIQMEAYLKAAGANCKAIVFGARHELDCDISEVSRLLQDLDSNNKLIYFSGHGSKDGTIHVNPHLEKNYQLRYTAEVILGMITKYVRNGSMPGCTLTIVLDCCYAGKWAEAFLKTVRNDNHELNKLLKDRDTSASIMVNLRMAALPNQKSMSGPEDGLCQFTRAWLCELLKEPSGTGNGTKHLRTEPPMDMFDRMKDHMDSTPCAADFHFGTLPDGVTDRIFISPELKKIIDIPAKDGANLEDTGVEKGQA